MLYKSKWFKLLSIIFSLLVLTVLLLFFPFIEIKIHVNDVWKKYNPDVEYVVVDYNPINPKLLVFVPLSDEAAYLVKEQEYSRTSVFSFDEKIDQSALQQGFGQFKTKIYADSLFEAKYKYQKEFDSQGEIVKNEYEVEKQKPLLCQKIVDYPEQRDLIRKLNDFKFLYLGITYGEVVQRIPEKGVGEIGKTYIYSFAINKDDNNLNLIKIRLEFENGTGFIDGNDLNAKLLAVKIVDDECDVFELPLSDKPKQ